MGCEGFCKPHVEACGAVKVRAPYGGFCMVHFLAERGVRVAFFGLKAVVEAVVDVVHVSVKQPVLVQPQVQ